MILSVLGTGLLAAIGFWIFGGIALRLGGALLAIAGAAGLAITRDANSLLLVALGTAAWWTGHLHYALRRGAWRSALARCAFDVPWQAIWQGIGRMGRICGVADENRRESDD